MAFLNNEDNLAEGARVPQRVGTAMHGSLLPKVPRCHAPDPRTFAVERRYGVRSNRRGQRTREQAALHRIDNRPCSPRVTYQFADNRTAALNAGYHHFFTRWFRSAQM